MKRHTLPVRRVRNLLSKARRSRILVIGDVTLDQFIWGHVGRISPEAPVPVVEFRDEKLHAGRRRQCRPQPRRPRGAVLLHRRRGPR
jgi:D-beta-D-heptose 7-phosphate kinase/D-beta-D-heptose 1-phosphate adenosyltransferase